MSEYLSTEHWQKLRLNTIHDRTVVPLWEEKGMNSSVRQNPSTTTKRNLKIRKFLSGGEGESANLNLCSILLSTTLF